MTQATDHHTYKRAANAALLGLIMQLVIALGMAMLGLYAQASALYATTWHLFAGVAIWLILWLTYKQHQLERLEALEAEQLAQSDEQAARLFDEAGQQLAIARRRLEGFYKWGLNGVSLVVALYLLLVGGALLWQNYQDLTAATQPATLNPQADPLILALLSALIAFLAFIVGRYVSGMTRLRAWYLLRGGAGFMMGSALIGVLVLAAAVGVLVGQPVGFRILALVVPALMTLLGVEMLLALVLSIYRPRQTGEPIRPAFDSRILGWLSSPESIGRIVSETLNYQFGFEISRSWFYRLLARAVTPLMIIAALVLIGLSSIVIVAPHQQAILTRFGAMTGKPAGPGIHLKWPWPVGGIERYDVKRVHSFEVGSTHHGSHGQYIWDDQSGEQDEDYLITAPPRVADERARAQAAIGELVGARVKVSYTIDDVIQYATGAQNPTRVIEYLAQRAMDRHFATQTIDTMLSGGGLSGAAAIESSLQRAVDKSELGLAITDVTLVHVHPPQGKGVVDAFHEKIAALAEREKLIAEARKEAVQMLASVAGSGEQARQISQAKTELERLEAQRRELERKLDESASESSDEADEASPEEPATKLATIKEKIEQKRRRIESLIQEAGGEAAKRLAEARADRWARPFQAAGEARRFTAQLKAYEKAPRYYRMRQYLDVLASTLQKPRKFLMAAETEGAATIRLNLESAGPGIEGLLEQASE